MNDAPLSDILRQASIKTENQLMDFSNPSCQDCTDTGRITKEYIIFYQCGKIDHGTHAPGSVSQSSAESEYNAACTSGMALAHFRMLIHELLNKDPDIVLDEVPQIILDSKSDVCMANNGKDTKHTRHISRRVYFVSNDKKCKVKNIDCREGSLHLADIETKIVSKNDLNTRIKYIIVRLEN